MTILGRRCSLPPEMSASLARWRLRVCSMYVGLVWCGVVDVPAEREGSWLARSADNVKDLKHSVVDSKHQQTGAGRWSPLLMCCSTCFVNIGTRFNF